jgi:hypothetical protein
MDVKIEICESLIILADKLNFKKGFKMGIGFDFDKKEVYNLNCSKNEVRFWCESQCSWVLKEQYLEIEKAAGREITEIELAEKIKEILNSKTGT